jgi:SWI/SNF-related matrix-associated actin-dependent regulator 1 of chromatin subfamily A
MDSANITMDFTNTITAKGIYSPSGLSYLPYQRIGIEFILRHKGALLADDMGLGKTCQAIGVINSDPTVHSVLIICPASVKAVWKAELSRWLNPARQLSISIIDSTQWKPADIVIINYDRLHQHETELCTRAWDLIVPDECHYLKSAHTRRTGIATRLRAERRLALSGTPLLNRPRELLPVLTWLDPVIWPKVKWHEFGLRYCGACWNGFGWEYNGATHLEELSRVLRSTVMLRRTKAEVLQELPPKFRSVVEISPGTDLEGLIREELAAFEKQLKQERTSESYRDAVRNTRRFSPDGENGREDNLARIRHKVALAKVPLVVRFVEELFASGSGKLVLFAHHRDVIEQLQMQLVQYGPVTLYGGTSTKGRFEAVERFQTDPNIKVFIGNIQAAGVGITLAPASSHCIFAELSWVPAEMTQAEDRLHRIGARDNVLVQHLVLEGSLDALMIRRLIKKQEILFRVLETKCL